MGTKYTKQDDKEVMTQSGQNENTKWIHTHTHTHIILLGIIIATMIIVLLLNGYKRNKKVQRTFLRRITERLSRRERGQGGDENK